MTIQEIIGNDTYIIAEMSANHAGSLERALEIVHAAKEAGADCLKIQTYTPDSLTLNCHSDDYQLKGGLWDGYYYYDLYQEALTPYEWHQAIKDECKKVDIDFFSTPFCFEDVDFLEELGVDFYKIASFESIDIPLIEYVAKKGKPIIMSVGMASVEEIEEALDACYRQGNKEVALLKCCSQYPANYDDMNLARIQDMRERFKVPVGLSDHSFGSLAPVVAVTMGASIIEKHICISRAIKNPDSGFSMEKEEFAAMVKDVRDAKRLIGSTSYELTEHEKNSLAFRRSLVACANIKAGEPFTADNIRSVRPAIGIKPKYYNTLLKKTASKDYEYGQPIGMDEIE